MTTVSLCMIVKDEAHVIERCLRSVVAVGIKRWVISDTGSTDGTPEKIAALAKELGAVCDLSHDPWIDFSTNRTLVCNRARGTADWLVWIDADGTFEGSVADLPDALDTDVQVWAIPLTLVDTRYTMFRILRGDLAWHFEGELHEHVHLGDRVSGYFPHLQDRSYPDGARSRNPNKWLDDAKLLETLPRTARNVFHLAQSYREAHEYEKARACFLERAEMDGLPEEIWCARLYAARLAAELELPSARDELLECYSLRPKRAEPLVDLARLSRAQGKDGLAFMFASQAMELKEPQREMFAIDLGTYRWKAREEFYVACAAIGLTTTARQIIEFMLASELPEDVRARAEMNMKALNEHEAQDE